MFQIVAVVKESERFVFSFDDESVATVLQQITKAAADKSLPGFTWHDAAILSQKVRDLQKPVPVPRW